MGGVLKSVMGSVFGEPPAPVAPPAPPTVTSAAPSMDAAAEAQRQALLAGRSSTVLTGGAGVSSLGNTTSSKLLGSA
jgi:hypothetical protein